MNKSSEYNALCQELQAAIDNEMNKPDDEMNPDTIKHCVDLLHEIENYELPANSQLKTCLSEIKGKQGKRPVVKRLVKVASLAASFIILVGVTNLISARAFNVNFINSIVEVSSGLFKINFGNSDYTLLNAQQINAELRAKAEKEGIDLLLPAYYPQKFSVNEFKVEHLQHNININIMLKTKNSFVKFYIDKKNKGDLEFKAPNGDNVEELEIKDFKVYITKVEKDYFASFSYENIVYNLIFNNCSYSEFIKVLESISK